MDKTTVAIRVFFFLVVGGFVFLWINELLEKILRSSNKEDQDESDEEEDVDPDKVIRKLQLGYTARRAVDHDELRERAEQGQSVQEIAEHLVDVVVEAPGLTVGNESIGQPVKLAPEDRKKHLYVIGKTGVGKSTLLQNFVIQDLENDRGVGVISPEVEFVRDDILPHVPERRLDDVIYVNPIDDTRQVGFNPLSKESGETIDRQVSNLMAIFKDTLDVTGARMKPLLRNSLYALIEREGTTLLDLYELLDPDGSRLRQEVIAETENPTVARFFKKDFSRMSKKAYLPVTNRLDRVLGSAPIRNTLCQPQSSFSFREAMDNGRILLFNLSDGQLGQTHSQLLGQLVVRKFQQALLSRADQPRSFREPFGLYVDEFQRYVGGATESYEQILSRARKYNMQLALAHQQTGQVPRSLLEEIFGNVGTIIAFQVSRRDASRIAKEFVDTSTFARRELEDKRLLTLDTGQAWCKIGTTYFWISTPAPPGSGSMKRREAALEASRENYGASPVTVSPEGEDSAEPSDFWE